VVCHSPQPQLYDMYLIENEYHNTYRIGWCLARTRWWTL